MNRKQWKNEYMPGEGDIEALQDGMENAVLNVQKDMLGVGIVTENGDELLIRENGTPDLTVRVDSGLAFDGYGKRISVPTGNQVVNIAVDKNAIATAVSVFGNEKYISICAVFSRQESGQVTAGPNTWNINHDETYSLEVIQGVEAVANTAVRPSIAAGQILLADILMTYGKVSVINADIDRTRCVFINTLPGQNNELGNHKTDPMAHQAVIASAIAAHKAESDLTAHAGLNARVAALEGAQLPPVQSSTELKAIATGGMAGKDKINIFVEDEKSAYWWDEQSSVAESLPDIVAPTSGPGRWKKIVTSTAMPTCTTGACTNVLSTSMTLNADLITMGEATRVSCGFYYKLSSASTWSFVAASTENLYAPGAFSANVSGLAQNTSYDIKAVTQGHGLGLGTLVQRTTANFTLPSITTSAATVGSVKNNIVMNGNLTSLGDSANGNVWFEWKPQGAASWTSTTPVSKSATGAFSDNITVTEGYITYEIRAVAQGTQDGPVYGSTVTLFVGGDFWLFRQGILTPRQQAVSAMVDGIIYVIGGQLSNYNIVSANEAYNTITNTWSTKAPMSTARRIAAIAVVNGKIYVIGGMDSTDTDISSVEVYDPSINTWSIVAPMPSAKHGMAATCIGNTIYVVGGYPTATSIYAYDTTSNTWSTKTPMPTGRHELSVIALGGVLYAIGGADGASNSKNEKYDPATNAWSTVAPMPTGRYSTAIAVALGKIYVLGGTGMTTINEVYDPSINTWSIVAPLPSGIVSSYFIAETVSERIYVAGSLTAANTLLYVA